MSRNSRGPVGFVTKSGKFAATDVLDQFAMKSSSEQIDKDAFVGLHGLVEPLYDPHALARHMEANTYHARAVRTKAQDTAGLGWDLTPLTDNPNEAQRKTADDWFADLEEEITEVFVQAMTDRESVGWFTIELAREGKEPDGPIVLIKNIPAHTMRAHEDGKRLVQSRGRSKRWFKIAGMDDIDVHKESGRISPAKSLDPEDRANEVVWNNIYTSRSTIYGVPDHIPAVGAILGDVARRDYNIAFFENYGVPAYAVYITGDFDPGEEVNDDGNTEDEEPDAGPYKTDLHRQIEEHVRDLANDPHSVLVLGIPSRDGNEVEVKFEPLATEIKEASFRLYRQDNLKEVLSAHAVPPYRAGIAEQGSLGGNVAENMDEIYRDSVIAPRQRILNRIVNRFILPSLEISDWVFELSEIDLTDIERDLGMALKLFKHGAMSPNDLIRNFGAQFGVEPLEDVATMNAHYLDGQPLDIEPPIDDDEVEAVMASVRDSLLEVAHKHVSKSTDGSISPELLDAIQSLQTSPATAAPNGSKTRKRTSSHLPASRNGSAQ